MRDAAVQLAAKLAENGREIGVRVALMQEYRLAEPRPRFPAARRSAARCAAGGEKLR